MKKIDIDIPLMEKSLYLGDGKYLLVVYELLDTFSSDKVSINFDTSAELVWFLSNAAVVESYKKNNSYFEVSSLLNLILESLEKEDLYDLLREVEGSYMILLKEKGGYVDKKREFDDSLKNFILMINFIFNILSERHGGFENKRDFSGFIFQSMKSIYDISAKKGKTLRFNIGDFSQGIMEYIYDEKEEPKVYL